MSGKMEKACGADIHRDFLVATILSTDGSKLQNRFDTSFVESRNYFAYHLSLDA
jgi:hypothetical protein